MVNMDRKREYFNHVMKLLNNREVEVQLSDLDFILDDVICDECPAKDKCGEDDVCRAPCREWDKEFNNHYRIKVKVTVEPRSKPQYQIIPWEQLTVVLLLTSGTLFGTIMINSLKTGIITQGITFLTLFLLTIITIIKNISKIAEQAKKVKQHEKRN